MCGRFTLAVDPQQIQQVFGLDTPPNITARYNIAPTQPVAVITNEHPHTLTFQRWGLIPSWAKDTRAASNLINARSETVSEKPSFRNAFKRRRCLIPADGWYEWRAEGKEKLPHYFHFADQRVFAMAGLWEVWQTPEGDEVQSCAILTTDANPFIHTVHHRMPVILHPEDYPLWLSNAPEAALLPLLQPFEGDPLAGHRVSKTVNRPVPDEPALIAPLQEDSRLAGF